MANRVNKQRPASGFRGVSLDAKKKKWIAVIAVDGVSHRLGRFSTPEDAHAAYREAQLRLHGEFAANA